MFKKLILVLMVMLLAAACAPAASPTSVPAATEGTEVAAEPSPTPEELSEQGGGEETEGEERAEARGTREELEAYTGWTCPEAVRGGTLNVYNWSTYVAPDTISNFQVLCDATVTYDIYDGNESLLARLRQGNPGYDVIVPSDWTVAVMITEELIQTLDMANIPNFSNLSEGLRNPPYDPGNRYSVAYQWGTIGIGYNTANVTEAPTSWNNMFEFQGNVAWLEDPRSMMGIALTMLGLDPNTTDAAEIEQARDFLAARGTNVRAIAVDDGQALLERGEVDMTVEYNGDIFQLMDSCECDTYNYVIPSEGANIWVDNLAIPVGAPNKALAEAFIDYILAPRVGADISNYTAYASPNQASIDQQMIDAELLGNAAIYPDDATRANLFYISELPADVAALYNDAWDQIKIMIGG
ncbi:MAG: spermidine/putrescine ABC transporter substrate-binding protein [Anaerolineae bacterium]